MRSRSSAAARPPGALCALHAGVPLLLPAALALLLGCSGQKAAAPAAQSAPAAPAPPSQAAKPADPGLTAEIGYNARLLLFRIENRDSFPWSNCQFNLNAEGTDPGYTLEITSLKPGLTEAAQLRVGDFADAAGGKFDADAHKVKTLDFGCDTPRGRLYYGDQFRLGETTRPGQPQ